MYICFGGSPHMRVENIAGLTDVDISFYCGDRRKPGLKHWASQWGECNDYKDPQPEYIVTIDRLTTESPAHTKIPGCQYY